MSRPALLAFALVLLAAPAAVRAQSSALGVWEFDPTKKSLYVESVQASQDAGNMSEIAAQMGMARVQNSTYELNFDERGPFLRITDKATRDRDLHYLRIRKEGRFLHLEALDESIRYTLEHVDPDRIVLVDEAISVRIPLRRL